MKFILAVLTVAVVSVGSWVKFGPVDVGPVKRITWHGFQIDLPKEAVGDRRPVILRDRGVGGVTGQMWRFELGNSTATIAMRVRRVRATGTISQLQQKYVDATDSASALTADMEMQNSDLNTRELAAQSLSQVESSP